MRVNTLLKKEALPRGLGLAHAAPYFRGQLKGRKPFLTLHSFPMAYTFIAWNVADGVATITLNRPDKLNSFNRAMALEMQDALAIARDDDTIRAILITGAGRAFCAGQDLAEAIAPEGQPQPDLGGIVRDQYNPIVRLVRTIEKPIVAAVNGVAAGAGANIALACDLVLASEKASFVQAFAKIGLIPDSGGTFLLPRLIGLQRATALMFMGDKLRAPEALNMGLIYKMHAPDVLMDEANKLATYLATQPTKGFGLTKRALNAAFTNDLSTHLDLEETLQREAGASDDYTEGVRAFLEKRAPVFTGK